MVTRHNSVLLLYLLTFSMNQSLVQLKNDDLHQMHMWFHAQVSQKILNGIQQSYFLALLVGSCYALTLLRFCALFIFLKRTAQPCATNPSMTLCLKIVSLQQFQIFLLSKLKFPHVIKNLKNIYHSKKKSFTLDQQH